MNKMRFILILLLITTAKQLEAQDSSALHIAERVADKVIRETVFAFELQPQLEQLGMQIIDFRHFNLQKGQAGSAFRHAKVLSDTVIHFGVSSGGPVSITVNGMLVYRQHKGNIGHPKEIAYGRFRFDTTFTALLKKGSNLIMVNYLADTGRQVVFVRPVLNNLDLDKSVNFDTNTWLMAAFPSEESLDTASKEIKPYYIINNKMIAWQSSPIHYLPELVIPANATYRRDSYADWNYSNGATLWSIMALEDARYTDFIKKYSCFTLDNEAYFRWQYDSLHAYRGGFHRIFRQSMLDDAGTPALPLAELYLKNKDSLLKQWLMPIADYVYRRQMRLADGTFCRPEPVNYTVWADDLFMSVPFLLRIAAATGDTRYYDEAAQQAIHFKKYLLDPKTGLYKHGWFSTTGERSAVFWGRANGWIVWATAELLLSLPPRHPQFKTILAMFRQHIDHLLPYQEAGGMWGQVLDRPDAYKETSCTALFTLAIARGVRKGWLPPGYKKYAVNGWNAVRKNIDADGTVHGICRGTEIGNDVQFYLDRQTIDHDPRGLGAVITAGIEISKLK